jgi:hypothetical protein
MFCFGSNLVSLASSTTMRAQNLIKVENAHNSIEVRRISICSTSSTKINYTFPDKEHGTIFYNRKKFRAGVATTARVPESFHRSHLRRIMSLRTRTLEPTWPLRIKTVATELMPIEITKTTTVRQLKRMISEQAGFLEPSQRHAKRLRLMHTPKKKLVELKEDSNTLEFYGINENVELGLIVDDLPSFTKVP